LSEDIRRASKALSPFSRTTVTDGIASMAKAQSVDIAGHQFPRKTDALAFLKVMLNRYRPGDTVSDADKVFLLEALKRHPEAAAKIGAGVKGFEVRSAEYGTQCFWILRVDGSDERFSYKSCI
jgi:hypothetical protein